jgi:hypothetical protein
MIISFPIKNLFNPLFSFTAQADKLYKCFSIHSKEFSKVNSFSHYNQSEFLTSLKNTVSQHADIFTLPQKKLHVLVNTNLCEATTENKEFLCHQSKNELEQVEEQLTTQIKNAPLQRDKLGNPLGIPPFFKTYSLF